MSILVRFSPPSMTAEQYDSIVERLYKEGVHPDPGLELELCFGSGDQMKVSLLFSIKKVLCYTVYFDTKCSPDMK